MKTYLAKKETVQPKWYLVDADGQVLGRLAVKLANIIRGRNKATYTAHVDTGDYVVVLNADKVVLTGKKEDQNEYMAFSGFVGGERFRSQKQMREKRPEFVIMHAVKGMLPSNTSCWHHNTMAIDKQESGRNFSVLSSRIPDEHWQWHKLAALLHARSSCFKRLRFLPSFHVGVLHGDESSATCGFGRMYRLYSRSNADEMLLE